MIEKHLLDCAVNALKKILFETVFHRALRDGRGWVLRLTRESNIGSVSANVLDVSLTDTVRGDYRILTLSEVSWLLGRMALFIQGNIDQTIMDEEGYVINLRYTNEPGWVAPDEFHWEIPSADRTYGIFTGSFHG